jgi:phage gp36-like protein
MSYTTRAAVEAHIPPDFVVKALDDDNDGNEDTGVFAACLAAVEDEIDGYLEPRYSLPLASVPKMIATAALHLLCEALYARRGYGIDTDPKNPFAGRGSSARALLREIRGGIVPLTTTTEKAKSQVDLIGEQSSLYPTPPRGSDATGRGRRLI